MYRMGIDLGGTTISAGLVNEKGEIENRLTLETGQDKSGNTLTGKLESLYRTLLLKSKIRENELSSVGIGVPGTANQKTGMIEDANNLQVEDYPFLQKLSQKIEVPIYFENDANTAALGEYYMAGQKAASFFMITLGTGVGGGYISEGKIQTGVNGAFGEIGHMVIESRGRLCNCGRRGCFERYVSVPALVKEALEMAEQEQQSILYQQRARMNGKLIFQAYRNKDRVATKLIDQFVLNLGEGIVNIINLLQPEILCIGGGISLAGDCFLEQLKQYVFKYRYSKNADRNTKIILAKNGNDAGIVGAAMLSV